MADQLRAFKEIPPAPKTGYRRGHPFLPPLKSALQKYIRRQEVAKAVAVADQMLVVPGGKAALLRRLPVIAAEDVGYEWVLPVVQMMTGPGGSSVDPDYPTLMGMVASLSAAPKCKEAYWLADHCWLGRTKIPPLHEIVADDLGIALEAGEYRAAVTLMIELDNAGKLHGAGGYAAVLHEYAKTLPAYAHDVVKAILWRTARGGAGELFAALAIAAIEKPTDIPHEMLSVTEYEVRPIPRPLDWYTLDGHVAIGARVNAIVGKRHGYKATTVFDLMFSHCSSKVFPVHEVPDRWKAEAEQIDAEYDGFESHAHGAYVWSLMEDDWRQTMGWLQGKEIEAGGMA